jgi:hypothetical protein
MCKYDLFSIQKKLFSRLVNRFCWYIVVGTSGARAARLRKVESGSVLNWTANIDAVLTICVERVYVRARKVRVYCCLRSYQCMSVQ